MRVGLWVSGILCSAILVLGVVSFTGFSHAPTLVAHDDSTAPEDPTTEHASPPVPEPNEPKSIPAETPTEKPEAIHRNAAFASEVQENIRDAEYNITSQEKSVIEGQPGGLHATNRAANLRAYFREDGVEILPRDLDQADWNLKWRFTRWGREDAMRSVSVTKPENDQTNGKRVAYKSGGVEEWYVNDGNGLEHGFTVAARPAGEGPLIVEGEWSGLSPRAGANAQTIGLFDAEQRQVLQYGKLVVTDNANKILSARLQPVGQSVRIIVNDSNAVYPVTIDPIYSPPPPESDSPVLRLGSQLFGEAGEGFFGQNLFDAQDVNGDGYSDILVVVYAGQAELPFGAAYLFFGSEGGIRSTGPSQADSTLTGDEELLIIGPVCPAGDVNGDGFADTLFGDSYNNAAFLVYGGATGWQIDSSIQTASIITGESAFSAFGAAVASAGDVNNDGYSDILVSDPSYAVNEEPAGTVYLFLGSPEGVSATTVSDAASVVVGEPGKVLLGHSLSGIGDENGDGYADIAIGHHSLDSPLPFGESLAVFDGEMSAGTWKLTVSVYNDFLDGSASDSLGLWQLASSSLAPIVNTFTESSTSNGIDVTTSTIEVQDDVEVSALDIQILLASHVYGYATIDLESPSATRCRLFRGYIEEHELHYSDENGLSPQGTVTRTVASIYHGAENGLAAAETFSNPVLWSQAERLLTIDHDCEFSFVAGVGDFNGDGIGDTLLSSQGQNTRVSGLYLGTAHQTAPPAYVSPSEVIGTASDNISRAGDVNGDGYADFLLGAYSRIVLFEGHVTDSQAYKPVSIRYFGQGGMRAAGGGDINGDGFADILAGLPLFERGLFAEGSVYVFLGAPDPPKGSLDVYPGYPVISRGAGDVNGDGFDDIIIGAAEINNLHVGDGAAAIFKGSATGLDVTDETGYWNEAGMLGVVYGSNVFDYLGTNVAAAGDVNGDGYSDVLVASEEYGIEGDPAEQTLAVFDGKDAQGDWTLRIEDVWRYGLHSLDSWSLTFDGVGTWHSQDTPQYIVFADQVILSTIEVPASFSIADVNVTVEVTTDYPTNLVIDIISPDGTTLRLFNTALADTDGIHRTYDDEGAFPPDGNPLPNNESFGKVHLFLGSATGLLGGGTIYEPGYPELAQVSLADSNANTKYGQSMSGLGDVNGDGYGDVLIAAPNATASTLGLVDLFLGTSSGLPAVPTIRWEGNSTEPLWYAKVGSAGDVNGDGYADFMIGAPFMSRGHPGEGVVFLFLGSSNAEQFGLLNDAPVILEGNQTAAFFGYSLSGVGDVNGDGFDDVTIGAPYFDNGQIDEGAAFLFLGSTSGIEGSNPYDAAVVLDSNVAGAGFGSDILPAGDLNGDGFADAVLSTSYYNYRLFLGGTSGLLSIDPVGNSLPMDAAGALAGDVNGDGYADLGTVVSFYPNLLLGGPEERVIAAPSLSLSNGQQWGSPGINIGSDPVTLRLTGGSPPLGIPSRIRMEYQIVPYDNKNLEQPILFTDWVNAGDISHTFESALSGLEPNANGYAVRCRIAFLPESYFRPGVTAPMHPPHGRWYTQDWVTPGPSDFRVSDYRSPTNAGGITLTPVAIKTTDPIVCSVNLPSVSPNNPPSAITYEFKWTSNTGRTIVHTSPALSDTLSPLETRRGDIWSCAVRAFDGSTYSHTPAKASASPIHNTSPGVPTSAITSSWSGRQSANDNLVCEITSPAMDPDVDEQVESLVYSFEWYKNGERVIPALGQPQTFNSSTRSVVERTALFPGDVWACVVTAADTVVTGTPFSTDDVEVVSGGVQPSQIINFGALPQPVTLGNEVTLSAQILPAPSNPGGAGLSFAVTSPSGSTQSVPFTTLDGPMYRAQFLPTSATATSGAWTSSASWPGDNVYSAATSLESNFTVQRARPTISVEINRSSALLNLANADDFSVKVALDVPGFPDALSALLANRPIYLAVSLGNEPRGEVPGTTDSEGLAVFAKADLLAANILFDEVGVWKFKAEFRGDDNLFNVVSPDFDRTDATLEIKSGAGYAIIVHGRLNENGEGMPEHALTADGVYRALIDREFVADDIYYLRQPSVAPVPSDISVAKGQNGAPIVPSPQAVLDAIGIWAVNKIQTSRAPLYIIIVSHGSLNTLHLDIGGTGPSESLSAEQLGVALNTSLDARFAAPDTAPTTYIVYGACHSGSFVPALTKSNRVIITSARANEKSYRGVDPTPDDGISLRDGEYFVSELFRNLRAGFNFESAFRRASDRTIEYTSIASNNALGDQNPILDDPAKWSETSVLGLESNSSEGIGWFTARPSFQYSASKADGTFLFAETTALNRAWGLGDAAWIEVKTPLYLPLSADEGEDDFQKQAQLVGPIPPINQMVGDGGKIRFEWTQQSVQSLVNFNTPGTYKVFYFLRDGATGQVSSYLVTNIYVPRLDNQPPNPVKALVSPLNGAVTSSQPVLTWEPADQADPDTGDTVTYRVVISPVGGDPEPVVIENIQRSYVEVSGLQDLTQYDWQVIPVDSYGATPSSGIQTFRLSVNNGNPGIPGTVLGLVLNLENSSGIGGANIVTTGPGAAAPYVTPATGYFAIGNIPSGQTFTLTVSRTGYLPSAPQLFTLSAGQVLQLPAFYLTPDSSLETGTIAIEVTPNEADWILSGPATHFGRGDLSIERTLAGTYTILWKPLPGKLTPLPETKTLAAKGTVTFSAKYETPPANTISVRVFPKSISAPWTLSGTLAGGSVYGPTFFQGDKDISSMAPGVYSLTWGDVNGWELPYNQPSAGTLVVGGSLVFEGVYIPSDLHLPPSTRNSAVEKLSTIHEELIPLDKDGNGHGSISTTQPIAIRIQSEEPLAVSSIECDIKGEDGIAERVQGKWIPIDGIGENDGWFVIRPQLSHQLGKSITVIAHAISENGTEVVHGPFTFHVSEIRAHDSVTPSLLQEQGLPELPESLGGAVGEAYRVTPVGVFDEPVSMQLPVPNGFDPETLSIFYFSESSRHPGWFPVERVNGLLAEPAQRGNGYVTVSVNHSGVLALGQPVGIPVASIGPVDIVANGSALGWAIIITVATSLAILALACARIARSTQW
ncbi:MAG: hypothetical protein AMXMBFR84_49960 [Candidatus Hydrogenedentota bacterium]